MFFAPPSLTTAIEYRFLMQSPEGNLCAWTPGELRENADRACMELDQPSNLISYGHPESGVQAFIREHSLAPSIDAALRLAAANFEIVGSVTIEREADPEFADEWVTVRLLAKGEMEEVLDAYDVFTREIVRILAPDVSRKVRLSVGMA